MHAAPGVSALGGRIIIYRQKSYDLSLLGLLSQLRRLGPSLGGPDSRTGTFAPPRSHSGRWAVLPAGGLTGDNTPDIVWDGHEILASDLWTVSHSPTGAAPPTGEPPRSRAGYGEMVSGAHVCPPSVVRYRCSVA